MRSPVWQNKLVLAGGHIEWGEKAEDALKREVLEETGLKIDNLKFLGFYEFVNTPYYRDGKQHFISLSFSATAVEPIKVNLDGPEGNEGTEYFWMKPEDILKNDDVEETIKDRLRKMKDNTCPACSELKAGWQRAVADYQNLVKETEKRRAEWADYAKQMILEEFIPVYDHLKLAISEESRIMNHESDSESRWLEGVKHVKKQFADILKNNGVEEIKTVGEKFDPALHEAVGEEDVTSATPPTPSWKEGEITPGTIIREVSGGYRMGERVIRAAKVIVSK